jgi:hypothetical protein
MEFSAGYCERREQEMFLDKLWLRIRGELLTLREDLSAGDDLRDKARTLLDRLEAALGDAGGQTEQKSHERVAQRSRESEAEIRPSDMQSLREIEVEWEKLRQRKDNGPRPEADEGPAPPNPRRLG